MERPGRDDGEAQGSSSEPASSNTPKQDYEVGYGKPPERPRWKKGVSGNPGGRKPGVKNFATHLKAALNQIVPVKVGKLTRKMTVRQAIAHRLVASSAANDLKAIAMLLPLMQQIEAASEQGAARSHTRDDEAVMKSLRERFGKEGGNDHQP